jgi:hypothetical protein
MDTDNFDDQVEMKVGEMRYVDYIGLRLVENVQFVVDGNVIAEYVTVPGGILRTK